MGNPRSYDRLRTVSDHGREESQLSRRRIKNSARIAGLFTSQHFENGLTVLPFIELGPLSYTEDIRLSWLSRKPWGLDGRQLITRVAITDHEAGRPAYPNVIIGDPIQALRIKTLANHRGTPRSMLLLNTGYLGVEYPAYPDAEQFQAINDAFAQPRLKEWESQPSNSKASVLGSVASYLRRSSVDPVAFEQDLIALAQSVQVEGNLTAAS